MSCKLLGLDGNTCESLTSSLSRPIMLNYQQNIDLDQLFTSAGPELDLSVAGMSWVDDI